MKVLVGCEESQVVCKAFREKGHEAYSNDIVPCSGGHDEWHLQMDVFEAIKINNWDMLIAHPPCTYLSIAGNRAMKEDANSIFPIRQEYRNQAVEFFKKLLQSNIQRICIENPVGIISTILCPPSQYIQPYQYGEPHSKKTGLWLKNLPLLKPTEIVEPEMYIYKSNGKKDPKWHVDSLKLSKEERRKVRSKFFPGVAKAMAEQWNF